MRKPVGFTINIGWNSWGLPKVVINKQTMGNLRPRIYNDEGMLENVKLGGVKFDFGIGTWRRPIPKFWKMDFWNKDYRIKSKYNPWNSGNHWFVLNIPVFPYIFICAYWKVGDNSPGFYFGGRTAEMNPVSHWLIDYSHIDENGNLSGDFWMRDEDGKPQLAWGTWGEEGNYYVEPTLSIRKDMAR